MIGASQPFDGEMAQIDKTWLLDNIVADIKSGMTSSALMKKYGLPRDELKDLCGHALQRDLVSRTELEELSLLPSEAPCPRCKWLNLTGAKYCTECGELLKNEPISQGMALGFHRRLIGPLLALICLLSIKYVDIAVKKLSLGAWVSCAAVSIYFIALATIFYGELQGIRTAIRNIICDSYFREGRLFYWLCHKRTVTRMFSLIGASVIAISLLLFAYLADSGTVSILFLDVLLFIWWRGYLPGAVMQQLSDRAQSIVLQMFLIGMNVGTLFILFLVVWVGETYFLAPEVVNPFEHPDVIAETVVSEVKHSCVIFRTIARFGYALSLTVEGLQTLPGLGKWLYPLFYLTNLSLLPFIGITLLFNRCYTRR